MADDTAALVVRLEATVRQFQRQMNQAKGIADRSAKDIEKRLSNINPGADALVNSFKRIGAAALAAFSVDQVRQAVDAYTKIQNALKVAGLEGDKLRTTYEALFAIAQRQGTSIESTATLYGRLAASQKELGVGSNDLLKFTEGVGTALRVAGTDATAASGALLQLGQALGGGKIQAEEFNSILDGARPVLQAVANGLIEAGGSVAKLTALVKDGQVSSQAFFRAFLAGLPELERQAQSAGSTSSQAFERIQNSLINLAGELDKAGNVSQTFATGLGAVASGIDAVTNAIPRGIAALREFINLQNQVLTGTDFGGQAGKIIGRAEGNGFSTGGSFGATPPEPITGSEGRIGRGLARQAPVSLRDFPVVGEKKGGGGKSGGGGGAASQSEFEREVQQIQRRTAALEQEATTVGKSAFEADRAKAAYELMEAAKRAGLSTTPALTAQIDQLSQAYAQSEQTVRAAEEAQRSMNELAQFAGDSISGFFSDIISGGENAEKALMNLTKRLADAALQAALLGDGPLAGLFGGGKAAGGGVGGLIGGLLKFIPGFAGGTRSAPGGLAMVGERGPELVNLPKGSQVIPNDVLMGAAGRGGQSVVVNISATNNGGMSPTEMAAFGRTIRDAAINGTFEAIRRGR